MEIVSKRHSMKVTLGETATAFVKFRQSTAPTGKPRVSTKEPANESTAHTGKPLVSTKVSE